jgi:hypothetical protein
MFYPHNRQCRRMRSSSGQTLCLLPRRNKHLSPACSSDRFLLASSIILFVNGACAPDGTIN